MNKWNVLCEFRSGIYMTRKSVKKEEKKRTASSHNSSDDKRKRKRKEKVRLPAGKGVASSF